MAWCPKDHSIFEVIEVDAENMQKKWPSVVKESEWVKDISWKDNRSKDDDAVMGFLACRKNRDNKKKRRVKAENAH